MRLPLRIVRSLSLWFNKIVNEEIVDVFDHATVFNKNTPHVELARELMARDHHVLLVDYQPTSEMTVSYTHLTLPTTPYV